MNSGWPPEGIRAAFLVLIWRPTRADSMIARKTDSLLHSQSALFFVTASRATLRNRSGSICFGSVLARSVCLDSTNCWSWIGKACTCASAIGVLLGCQEIGCEASKALALHEIVVGIH